MLEVITLIICFPNSAVSNKPIQLPSILGPTVPMFLDDLVGTGPFTEGESGNKFLFEKSEHESNFSREDNCCEGS